MSQASVFDRVQTILIDHIGVEATDIREDAKIRDDLGADSLDLVEIVMEVEDEFGIEINDEEAEKIETVGDIVRYVSANLRD